MDGYLAVDKPAGWTSHDVVNYVRRTLGVKKAGHTGTLDPAATGLLIVLVGRATRLARYFEADEKTYEAVLSLGSETDTLDADGAVTGTCPVPELTADRVEQALEQFRGDITQVPPRYSAVKVGGRPLYKHARAGVEVEASPRTVSIRDIRLAGLSEGRIRFVTTCSKGTYIRTLACDIARALGSCGHLETLRRTSAGGLSLDGAADLASKPGKDELSGLISPMENMLGHITAVRVGPDAEAGVLNGRRPLVHELEGLKEGISPGMKIRILGSGGRLIAVAGAVPGEGRDEVAVRLEVVLS